MKDRKGVLFQDSSRLGVGVWDDRFAMFSSAIQFIFIYLFIIFHLHSVP